MLDEKKDLIKKTIAKDCTDGELELFIQVCKRQGLDPFSKQIFPVKRGNVMTIQTSIDGYRIIAERSGNYMPGASPTFVFDEKGALVSATAYVKKMDCKGQWHEIGATAYYEEYVQKFGDKIGNFWAKMPRAMLAKCAESLALRKAFPAEMGGTYTPEEMSQADEEPASKALESIIGEKEGKRLDDMIGDDLEYRRNLLEHFDIDAFSKLKADKLPKLIEAIKKHNEMRLKHEMNDAIEVK